MHRTTRVLGTLLIGAGVLTLAWAVVVWRWQDPFTALYTHWQQGKLAHALQQQEDAFQPSRATGNLAAERREVALDARRYQKQAKTGQAIGRIVIGRIGLNMVLVNGTDHETLKKGPGRDPRSYMPGENRLVYIAGHRTTYLAPFRRIDQLRRGDRITLEMPYARLTYAVERQRIVAPTELSVIKRVPYDRLVLSACHPLYSAAKRIVVFARLVGEQPRGAAS
jgi:sortase A